jgi:catecholate siderophore receptor
LSLGAVAAGFGLASLACAQPVQPAEVAASAAPSALPVPDTTLRKITVKGKQEEQGKDSLKAGTTRIGKGTQELRDVPQSVTVVTEKLIDDRNLDTLKEALHYTAGITFQAAEGGEEDIRLRGFSLASTGDIFVDGMRDPAFYDRDTFNYDRIELLRGSASMLFGRGSTGGVVNQVNKQPFLATRSEVDATLGTGSYLRVAGDFNIKTGDDAALRLNTMLTDGDNRGLKTDKTGFAGTYRWGIGTADDLSIGLYYLDNRNGINYGIPWLPTSSAANAPRTLVPVDPRNYYGLASDYNASNATYGTLAHVHRFGGGAELRTTFRQGTYTRDLRSGAQRFAAAALQPGGQAVTSSTLSGATVLTRGNNVKIQDMDTSYFQSDYSAKLDALGRVHEVLAGVDAAEEKFHNYGATALVKPTTTIGTPNDGAAVNEAARVLSLNRSFLARSLGVYGQDLVHLAPSWKLLGGLRWDYFKGRYDTPPTATVAAVRYERSDSLWSKRLGALYQPTPFSSYHVSYGTSFNTSGDTYQYDNQSANTPPEGSRNLELGGKFDDEDGQYSARFALFRTTKFNERNRDPDSAATQAVLSGKRHSAGVELDLAGRLTHEWEVFASYAWTPIARIDAGAPGVAVVATGETVGARPALTPKNSAALWTTYKLTEALRLGGGINARSSQTPNRNPVGVIAPGFVTGDLMAEYAFEQISFKLNVSNVTNKLYADALYTGHYIPGAGRTVQLKTTVKF